MIATPLILSVETATRAGSISLSRGMEELGFAIGNAQASHSNTLLRDIERVLENDKLTVSDIRVLAAASGPGSFTGLRIGLATVKALAVTLRVPCIGIPTLHAVATAAGESQASVAMLPAGRGEVFAQMLSVSSAGTVVELDRPAHLSPPELFRRYASHPRIRWCGEGAQMYRERIENWATQKGIDFYETPADAINLTEDGWQLTPAEPKLASYVGRLAFLQFQQGVAGDPESLRALYVRPSDAELKSDVNNNTASS